jgi:hypothetical protein
MPIGNLPDIAREYAKNNINFEPDIEVRTSSTGIVPYLRLVFTILSEDRIKIQFLGAECIIDNSLDYWV